MSQQRWMMTLHRLSLYTALAVVSLITQTPVCAIDWTAGATGFVKNETGLRLPFRFYSPPPELIPDRGLPLVVKLHGSSSRGTDNVQQVDRAYFQGLIDATQSEQFAAFLVAPQLPPNGNWNREPFRELALEMVESVVDRHLIDPDRIYVTGYSQGGFGTTMLINESPHLFAAGAPVAGAQPMEVSPFKHVPLAFFHGAKDRIVRSVVSDILVDRLRDAGASPVYVHTDDNHTTISRVYQVDELGMYEWMFQQENKDVMTNDTVHVGGWKTTGVFPQENEPFSELQLGSDQRLHIELEGSTAYDRLQFAGVLKVGGAELKVVLLDGELTLDDEYDIFDVGGFEGEFSRVVLPALPINLAWDSGELVSQGVLRIVSQSEAMQCDFNADARCTVVDLDHLVSSTDLVTGMQARPDSGTWDINTDGHIDGGDLQRWLKVAADLNGFASSYSPGDTDLNGQVELSDFHQLSSHFGERQGITWSHGDSDGNGIIDFSDFLRLSANFTGSSAAPVPEPATEGILIVGILALLTHRIFRRDRCRLRRVHRNVLRHQPVCPLCA